MDKVHQTGDQHESPNDRHNLQEPVKFPPVVHGPMQAYRNDANTERFARKEYMYRAGARWLTRLMAFTFV